MDMERGEGLYLFDTEGRRYVDFCAGIATCCLGHANPVVVEALCTQARKLMHCSNLYGIPGRVFFSNSGAESNDGIIKVARRFGHRHPAAQ
ncbi:MAG: aminotransferase class III-fold pyridoxal phosphate-dependent enzyme [Akkermansia sp.]|nr:aminotransferase class III-fold pyridoxal phosphate-dependent enzyme [Akkermansia sp.]